MTGVRGLGWMMVLAALPLSAFAPAPSEPTAFATPQEAARALVAAAEKDDTAALIKLFGPEGKPIVESGDAADDSAMRARFAARAQGKMQIEQTASRATIVVGPDEWPFPVPLVLGKDGKWRFDGRAGAVEVLARRIGRNELNAIEVCRGYVEAQMDYARADRAGDHVLAYAQHIVSSPGKKDGLYWDAAAPSLVPKAFAEAAAQLAMQGHKAAPFHGYYFHILKAQGPDADGGAKDYVVNGRMIGGFALVAWPAEYGTSGIRTFLVNQTGIVYEKDLGATTAALARAMIRFNPDKTWKASELE